MSTKMLLATSVVSVLILTGCQPSTAPSGAKTSPTSEATTNKQSGSDVEGIIRDIASGKSFRCTFTEKETSNTMEYAIRGQQVSARITMKKEAGEQVVRSIMSPPTIYWWEEKTKQGMKMTSTEMTDSRTGQPSIPNFTDISAWNALQNEYNYSCAPGIVTDSDFALPSDVTFTDLSQMMQGIVDKTDQ